MKNLINNNLKSSSFFSRLNWFMFFTLLVLVINLEVNTNNKEKNQKLLKTKNTNANEKTEVYTEATLSSVLKGMYWVQRMYPGSDVFDAMNESEYKNKKVYLEVNDEILFIAESIERKNEIYDSIKLMDIYEHTTDNIPNAKCCSRVTYEEFPLTNSIHNIIPAKKRTVVIKKKSKKSGFIKKIVTNPICSKKSSIAKARQQAARGQKAKNIPASRMSPVSAPSLPKKLAKKIKLAEESIPNLCIMINIPDEARWRICSTTKSDVTKLRIKINYSVIKLLSKNNPKIMEKIISNPSIFNSPSVGAWDWDNQDNWKGKCNSGFMQSPINISTSAVNKPKSHFDMAMNLKPTHVKVKKNFKEIIVVFTNFAGILKLSSNGSYLNYTPQYMSFRFPGETIIDGKRSQGDIQLHFAEMTEKTPVYILLILFYFY